MDKKQLKIAGMIFGSLLTMGGYQVFIYNLFKRLINRGHEIDLFLPNKEFRQHESFYAGLPFTVKPLPIGTKTLAKHCPKILKSYLKYQQNKQQYDIWQMVGAYPAAYLATALSGTVPLVLRTHGDDIQKDAALNYGMRLDQSWENKIKNTLHKMDRLVALTESVSECYRDLDIPEYKIVEIPNGTDIQRFAQPSDKMQTRQKWHLPTDKPLLLTVGRNHPKKGFDAIPKIARILKERNITFSWLVIGKDTDQLKPQIEAHGVSDSVCTMDEIGVEQSANTMPEIPHIDLIHLFQCADIFVFPSHLESFGRVLIEAMAAGLPIVTTNAQGCRYVVQHEITGLQSDPADLETSAQHIQMILKDAELRDRLKKNGHCEAQKYDWENIVQQYEALYWTAMMPQKQQLETAQ